MRAAPFPRAAVGRSDSDDLLHPGHGLRAAGAAFVGSQQSAGTGAGRVENRVPRGISRRAAAGAAFLIALSNIGAAGAYLAAVARLPFVAGLDRFLPPAFGALHPRWKTPWVALLTQFVLGAVFIFLGQAGTSVKGAYDVLVSMGVITYFIPYLYLFAAMIKLQREPAGPDVIRVPGGTAWRNWWRRSDF